MTRLYPDRPLVAVSAAVLSQGRILLVKRGVEPARGKWSLPGGGVELGETVRAAVVREIREECSIEIEPGPVLEVYDSIVLDNSGSICYHHVIICFRSTWRRGILQAGSDVDEARWVSLSGALEYDLAPGTRKVLQALVKSTLGPVQGV